MKTTKLSKLFIRMSLAEMLSLVALSVAIGMLMAFLVSAGLDTNPLL